MNVEVEDMTGFSNMVKNKYLCQQGLFIYVCHRIDRHIVVSKCRFYKNIVK